MNEKDKPAGEMMGIVEGYPVVMRKDILYDWRVFLPGDSNPYPLYARDLVAAGRQVCTPDQQGA